MRKASKRCFVCQPCKLPLRSRPKKTSHSHHLNSILILTGGLGATTVAQGRQSSVGLFIQTILSGTTSLPFHLHAGIRIEHGVLLHPRVHEHPIIRPAQWAATKAHRVTELPRSIDRIDVLLPRDTLRTLVEHMTMITRGGGEVTIFRVEGNQVGMRKDASTLL
jgi:hypothetical protein